MGMEDFLPGDRIEFMDDNIQGTIISIIDKQKVLIVIDDGLEIPAHKSEIVNLSSLERTAPKKDQSQKTKGSLKSELKNTGIFIGLQKTDNKAVINFYIINNTSNFIYFILYCSYSDNIQAITKGESNPNQFKLLTNFDLNRNHGFPTFTIHILKFDIHAESIHDPIVFSMKPNPKSVFNRLSLAPLMNEEMCLYKIEENNSIKVLKTKTIKTEESKVIHDIDKPPEVIDLHTDKLEIDLNKMSKSEILNFQYIYFINNLEKAIALEYLKVIFIHGIGNFSLKNKIHKYLKNNKFVKNYKDADTRKYGFGATEVVLFSND